MTRRKKPTREQLAKIIQRAVDEGRVEFAPDPPPELVPPPEFCERFAQEILHRRWEHMWVSGEAEVTDVCRNSRAEILTDLMRVYGVDCSDMKHLNIWRVMQRCREGGHC